MSRQWISAHRLTPRVLLALALALTAVPLRAASTAADGLPPFTEEREAAAVFFVGKHVPEMLPLLQRLKDADHSRYEKEICYIFQVTEILAEIRDNRQRHELELKRWVAQNRAQVLVARLTTSDAAERQRVLDRLREVAGELARLDVEVLRLKARQVEEQLREARQRLAEAEGRQDQLAQDRYRQFLDQFEKIRH